MTGARSLEISASRLRSIAFGPRPMTLCAFSRGHKPRLLLRGHKVPGRLLSLFAAIRRRPSHWVTGARAKHPLRDVRLSNRDVCRFSYNSGNGLPPTGDDKSSDHAHLPTAIKKRRPEWAARLGEVISGSSTGGAAQSLALPAQRFDTAHSGAANEAPIPVTSQVQAK